MRRRYHSIRIRSSRVSDAYSITHLYQLRASLQFFHVRTSRDTRSAHGLVLQSIVIILRPTILPICLAFTFYPIYGYGPREWPLLRYVSIALFDLFIAMYVSFNVGCVREKSVQIGHRRRAAGAALECALTTRDVAHVRRTGRRVDHLRA